MRRAYTKLQLIHSKPDRTLSSITALINEYEQSAECFARESVAIIYFYQYLEYLLLKAFGGVLMCAEQACAVRCQMLRSTRIHCTRHNNRTSSPLIGSIHLHLTKKAKTRRASNHQNEYICTQKNEKRNNNNNNNEQYKPQAHYINACLLLFL